jgi:hypothetical protein
MPENDPPIQGRDLLGKITEVHRAGSVFVPARERSPFCQIVAYLLCHWGLLRRVGLRLRGRRRNDGQVEVALVEAAS